MKKYKYQRLSKEEKKQVKDEFYNTNQGMELKVRFKRILIYSILLLLFGLYLLIDAYINKDSYAQYVYGAIMLMFGVGFLISRSYVMMKKVNDYITKPKKTTKK